MDKLMIIEGLNQVYSEKRYEGNMRGFEGKTRKTATYAAGAALGAIGPGLVFTYLYRRITDRCRKRCSTNNICFNKCYADACTKVIAQIDAEINKAKQMDDKKKSEKKIKKLQKERIIWVKRLDKYKARSQS